jgi:hypothetical protein
VYMKATPMISVKKCRRRIRIFRNCNEFHLKISVYLDLLPVPAVTESKCKKHLRDLMEKNCCSGNTSKLCSGGARSGCRMS